MPFSIQVFEYYPLIWLWAEPTTALTNWIWWKWCFLPLRMDLYPVPYVSQNWEAFVFWSPDPWCHRTGLSQKCFSGLRGPNRKLEAGLFRALGGSGTCTRVGRTRIRLAAWVLERQEAACHTWGSQPRVSPGLVQRRLSTVPPSGWWGLW